MRIFDISLIVRFESCGVSRGRLYDVARENDRLIVSLLDIIDIAIADIDT